MRKILFLGVSSQNYLNFRKSLIRFLKMNDYEISVVAFDDTHSQEIESWGCKFFCVKGDNRSLNFIKMLQLKKRYKEIIQDVNPDIVITSMMKPNIFGVLAAKVAKVPKVYAMIDGMGDVFINNSLKWKIIRLVVCVLYKSSLRYCDRIIFSNDDDRKECIDRRLCKEEKCEVVRGPGVDLSHFSYKDVRTERTFLMIARMLKTKGIIEYCEAAKKVKALYPDAIFNYIGGEGTVTIDDIQPYISDGIIQYLGKQKDVRPYIEDATVNVLPSYREGMGMVNLEAGAMGRMSITCHTNGTKETVIDGYNGFLVPVGNIDELSEKMIWSIEHPNEVVLMGKNARLFCEENFQVDIINRQIFNIITGQIYEGKHDD